MAVAGLALARLLFLALLTLFLWQLYRAMQQDLRRAARPARGGGPLALVATASSGMTAPGRRYRVEGELRLGRLPDNSIVIDDDYASGHHARIWSDGGRCLIEDLGSTNGTLVNGRAARGTVVLEPGATVQVGGAVLRLEAERE